MVQYDLAHLTQAPSQEVIGPIQDDEALALFALIRCMRLDRVLEIGGLGGYSARNFLAAVGPAGAVYSVDIHRVPQVAPNHRCITKDARDLTTGDVDGLPLDLVFFDCHDMVQMQVFAAMREQGMITDRTVLALHDTNLHPHNITGCARIEGRARIEGGWEHQPVEREMTRQFRASHGYDVFSYHTTASRHDATLPYRHGLTICQKNAAFW